MTDTENENFSYEVFDRQLESFCRMLNVLIEAWDDYSPQELTFDIRSLCIKANRLCHMAEQDMVLQHNDLTKQRKENNEKYEVTLSIVVLDEFTPPHVACYPGNKSRASAGRKPNQDDAA